MLFCSLRASAFPFESSKVAAAQRLSLIRNPDAPSFCEKSGLGSAIWRLRHRSVSRFHANYLLTADNPISRVASGGFTTFRWAWIGPARNVERISRGVL